MRIISFRGHSQVGQALGNYAWRWVPHPHTYTPTLWEQGTVIRKSGSDLELTEVASIFSEDDIGTYASRFHIGILQHHECH